MKRGIWQAGLALLVAGLLYLALRNAPLAEIRLTLLRLQPWQLVILALINLVIYLFISMRWWIIVRASVSNVPFLPLLAARVAVFGVSYFTLGPQVGGEALQVLVLQRRYHLRTVFAVSSVLMDKLLEFLVNFLLFSLGLAAVLRAGLHFGNSFQMAGTLLFLAALAAWPVVHITLMARRIYPFSKLAGALPFLHSRRYSRLVRFLRACEWMAGRFCRQHLLSLLTATLVSILAGSGMLLEYALMLVFLGLELPFWNLVTGWTAGWVSFLMPLPGGLGALEASQVLALGAFGVPAALAISLTLLIRARDLVIGGLGLLLAGLGFATDGKK